MSPFFVDWFTSISRYCFEIIKLKLFKNQIYVWLCRVSKDMSGPGQSSRSCHMRVYLFRVVTHQWVPIKVILLLCVGFVVFILAICLLILHIIYSKTHTLHIHTFETHNINQSTCKIFWPLKTIKVHNRFFLNSTTHYLVCFIYILLNWFSAEKLWFRYIFA